MRQKQVSQRSAEPDRFVRERGEAGSQGQRSLNDELGTQACTTNVHVPNALHKFRLLDLGEKEFVGKPVFLVALEHRFLVKIIA